jgi:hypothetical protein
MIAVARPTGPACHRVRTNHRLGDGLPNSIAYRDARSSLSTIQQCVRAVEHFGSRLVAERIEELPIPPLRYRADDEQLERIERRLTRSPPEDPLQAVFRRLDAIQELVRRRDHRQGGCVIGNLSTELSDTHVAFRKRLSGCFDEMAREYQPLLDAAVQRHRPREPVDTRALARYIVAIIEGSIMLARTHRDSHLMARHFDYLKEHLKRTRGQATQR